ncbi:RNase H domain-containing protein [Trichonephila clavipes]|nr:RNase H domain-containing protein [Trichonephila clavipes]
MSSGNSLPQFNLGIQARTYVIEEPKPPVVRGGPEELVTMDCALFWVPLHVNIAGNEIADSLAKDGAAQPTMNSAPLTYSELHSTYINNKQLIYPPAHHWYEAKRAGGFLSLQCSRQEQTILTRFRSGHLRTLIFRDGNKVFPTCVRCSACQASPEHILDCLGLSKQYLYEDPLMVLDFLRVNKIMDLV